MKKIIGGSLGITLVVFMVMGIGFLGFGYRILGQKVEGLVTAVAQKTGFSLPDGLETRLKALEEKPAPAAPDWSGLEQKIETAVIRVQKETAGFRDLAQSLAADAVKEVRAAEERLANRVTALERRPAAAAAAAPVAGNGGGVASGNPRPAAGNSERPLYTGLELNPETGELEAYVLSRTNPNWMPLKSRAGAQSTSERIETSPEATPPRPKPAQSEPQREPPPVYGPQKPAGGYNHGIPRRNLFGQIYYVWHRCADPKRCRLYQPPAVMVRQ